MTSELAYTPPPASPDAPARRGAFVVFEGGDGTGKSTQAALLAERLRAAGHDVVLTREPGGTEIGERLRALVLEQGQGEVDARTEALIYAASRAAHARQAIRPALERGAVVVCDRYIDSSAAYQGAGRGLGTGTVTALSRWATEDLLPDATLFLQVDGATARDRVGARGAPDRLESESDGFHATVDRAFRDLARGGGPRRTVDGSGTVEEVAARIDAALADVLPPAPADREGSR